MPPECRPRGKTGQSQESPAHTALFATGGLGYLVA
jgi:hypothetical protein